LGGVELGKRTGITKSSSITFTPFFFFSKCRHDDVKPFELAHLYTMRFLPCSAAQLLQLLTLAFTEYLVGFKELFSTLRDSYIKEMRISSDSSSPEPYDPTSAIDFFPSLRKFIQTQLELLHRIQQVTPSCCSSRSLLPLQQH
jgi:hypothetical protein